MKIAVNVKAVALMALVAMLGAVAAPVMAQQNQVRVGWCQRTISSAAAPFAIANKFGWYGDRKIHLVPIGGGGDCTKAVATKEIPYAIVSVEPMAVIAQHGVKSKMFYTAYQGNVYGIAVPADSPINSVADLKGKRVGVISMGSGSVLVARAVTAANGLDPDKDINIVVAGESAQTAAMIRTKQVDAVSGFDTLFALVEIAGQSLRYLPTKEIERFPSNGLMALDETLAAHRAEAVDLARGYAKGTLFAIANPEAAIRILWEQFPASKSLSKSEEVALNEDIKTLQARSDKWALEKGDVKRWGESNTTNYEAYLDFLLAAKTIKDKPAVAELVTNALIDEINDFNAEEVSAYARTYKYSK